MSDAAMHESGYEIRPISRYLANGHQRRWEVVRVRDGRVVGEYASRYDAEVVRRSHDRADCRGRKSGA